MKFEIELNDCELRPNLNTVASTFAQPPQENLPRPGFLSLPKSIPPQGHPCCKTPIPRNLGGWDANDPVRSFVKTSEISPPTVRFRPCACLTRTPSCTKHGEKTTQTWRPPRFSTLRQWLRIGAWRQVPTSACPDEEVNAVSCGLSSPCPTFPLSMWDNLIRTTRSSQNVVCDIPCWEKSMSILTTFGRRVESDTVPNPREVGLVQPAPKQEAKPISLAEMSSSSAMTRHCFPSHPVPVPCFDCIPHPQFPRTPFCHPPTPTLVPTTARETNTLSPEPSVAFVSPARQRSAPGSLRRSGLPTSKRG